MAEYCKVCGIPLKASNTVDYRPGSCRDCELERKKLYSDLKVDFGSYRTRKSSKSKKVKKKAKLKGRKKQKAVKTSLKKRRLLKSKLKKQKLLKVKKIKAKKLAKLKRLIKIRLERDKKKKKLRAKIEKLRKLRAKKVLKLKKQRKKQKERERKERERLKQRIRKAKERERRLLRKEREKLKKEKDKLRQLVRAEKDRARSEKRAEKDRIRAEKQRLRLEKQSEKERLKKAKEAAKLALIQAREQARQAAQEARRLREQARKQPIVSIVTKVREMLPPPDVKIISSTVKDSEVRHPQPKKILDPKKPGALSGASAYLLQEATVIPAKADTKEEKEILKQSTTAQHTEIIQKEVEKIQKDSDPIIDRYNPYETADTKNPRPPSATPWLASRFSVKGGQFEEAKEENEITSGNLTDDQVQKIIEKIKNEHKRKSS